MGFLQLLIGKDKYSISSTIKGDEPINPAHRTALIMPICKEDVERVFAGLRDAYRLTGNKTALAVEIADGWAPIFYSPYRNEVYEDALRNAKPGFEIPCVTTVVVTDDVSAGLTMVKWYLSLYIGGMGAKDKNFHFDVIGRMGFAAEAARVQELFLSGDRAGAANAVPDDLADEIDQASSEYAQSMIFRLRDREKFLLAKIDKALARIESGTFGVCEKCEEEISVKRLEARPGGLSRPCGTSTGYGRVISSARGPTAANACGLSLRSTPGMTARQCPPVASGAAPSG